jgi:PIN domain nuclease of toxin-antitoxin system
LKLLLDTHLLLWAAADSDRLPNAARRLMLDPDNELWFSVASLWEVAIKRGLNRSDFQVDPRQLRRGLVENDYRELTIRSEHVTGLDLLPPHHKDPFDRLLVMQARVEGIALLTNDEALADYGDPVRLV